MVCREFCDYRVATYQSFQQLYMSLSTRFQSLWKFELRMELVTFRRLTVCSKPCHTLTWRCRHCYNIVWPICLLGDSFTWIPLIEIENIVLCFIIWSCYRVLFWLGWFVHVVCCLMRWWFGHCCREKKPTSRKISSTQCIQYSVPRRDLFQLTSLMLLGSRFRVCKRNS